MKPEDFELFAAIIKQRSGLVLSAEKAYLLESRLIPIARKRNVKTLEDVAQIVRSRREESFMQEITEAMMSHDTHFFRDRKPFALFQKNLLPKLMAARETQKVIRIWCAGVSTGQEAYSLAMMCSDALADAPGWKFEILGTDLSREAIMRARSGIYTQLEAQRGLPIRQLLKYFQPLSDARWQVKEAVRQMVQFREGNLLADTGASGAYDVVLCRNVLGSFDLPAKARLLTTLGSLLARDGFLQLGGSENTLGLSDKFSPVSGENGLYTPVP